MKKLIVTLLFASAMASPAFAQDASPSIGDSDAKTTQEVTATPARDFSDVNKMLEKLQAMQGKPVVGKNGEMLGTVTGIDKEQVLAQIQTDNGRKIAMGADRLQDMGEQVLANVTRDDVVAALDAGNQGPDGIVIFETN